MNHPHSPDAFPTGRAPLSALRAFEAAARLGSFRHAAVELGLTPSAISHHVRDLEAELGARLFRRSHREVSLTEAGADLADKLTPAFSAIGAAYREARGNRLLRLSAAPLFAARFLLPKLDELRELLPHTTIEVESSIATVDLAAGPHDLALRFGPEPLAPLIAAKIGGAGFVIVAAPDLAAKFDRSDQAWSSMVPLLSLTRQPNAWSEVFALLELSGPRRELLFDSYEGVLRGAEDGLGAALLPLVICADQLASGSLIKVVDQVIDNGWSYWLVGRPSVTPANQFRRMAQWMATLIHAQLAD